LNEEFNLVDLLDSVKEHQKLEHHDNFLKLLDIRKPVEQTPNTSIIVFEYCEDGSLCEYLKNNHKYLDWDIKLDLAKQVAGALMHLHSNNIVHGNLNSKNIMVHKGKIKLNCLGAIKRQIISAKFIMKFNKKVPYRDIQALEALDSVVLKKSLDIHSFGMILWEISGGVVTCSTESLRNIKFLDFKDLVSTIPQQYVKICTDCLHNDELLRPSIGRIVEELDEIDLNDTSHDYIEIILCDKMANCMTNNHNSLRETRTTSDSNQFEIVTEFDYFIKNLFKVYIEDFNKQLNTEHVAHFIRNYIKKFNRNPCKIFHQLLQHKHKSCFTSLIGFFYRYGIGTKVDLKLAFELCAQAASDEVDFSIEKPYSLDSLGSFRRCNHEVGLISLGLMYLNGKGVNRNLEKAFQIFSKSAKEGSSKALSCEGYMYCNGV
ncbi:720_t:CDS:2, partial [Acaulospora morrowiae]